MARAERPTCSLVLFAGERELRGLGCQKGSFTSFNSQGTSMATQ